MDLKIETFSLQRPAETRTIVFRRFIRLWVSSLDDESSRKKGNLVLSPNVRWAIWVSKMIESSSKKEQKDWTSIVVKSVEGN